MKHLHPDTIRPWFQHWPVLEVSDEDANLTRAHNRLLAACKGLIWWLDLMSCNNDDLLDGWKHPDNHKCCRILWSGVLPSPYIHKRHWVDENEESELSIYFPLNVHRCEIKMP